MSKDELQRKATKMLRDSGHDVIRVDVAVNDHPNLQPVVLGVRTIPPTSRDQHTLSIGGDTPRACFEKLQSAIRR